MAKSFTPPLRRTGILGAGYISEYHIRALQDCPETVLQAICDADCDKAARLQRKYRIPNCYASLDEMVSARQVDVVHVLVPPAAHAPAALRCLESGCDVFLEKPMAVSASEAHSLHQTAIQHGRILGVNHNNTYHPAFTKLIHAVRERRLGALQNVSVTLNVPLRQLNAGQHSHWMFRRPENIILEQACHPLSQICLLLGPVRHASALVTGEMLLNTGVSFHDTWACSLVCERGTAQMFLGFGREFLDFSMQVIGQDGVAGLDFRRNIFRLSQKTRFMEPVDNFLDSARSGHATLRQGLANITGYSLGFLKIKPPDDPFTVGMRRSISAFYRHLCTAQSPREDSMAGSIVVEACEAVAGSRRALPKSASPEVSTYA